jgi:hypothetical protein
MADLPFPGMDSLVQPSAPSAPSVPSLAATPSAQIIIPDLGVANNASVSVPNVLSNSSQFQAIPEWTYKRFHLMDVFYSKIGISAMTSLLTFSVLSIINPPFVQEKGENPIEISKPSFPILYCISLVIFIMMMVVPVSKTI